MSEEKCSCGREAEIEGKWCTLHAPIEKKNPEDFWVKFKTYFENALEEYEKAGNKSSILLDCSYFVFPPFGQWRFPKEIPFHIVFTNAVFYGDAEFAGIDFKGQALFVETQFRPCPESLLIKSYTQQDLSGYPGFADFKDSLFSLKANFADSKFFCVADFRKGGFLAEANFKGAEFYEKADFGSRVFEGKADFNFAEFEKCVYFSGSSFTRMAVFGRAIFKGETHFSELEFKSNGVFAGAEFYGNVYLELIVKEFERDSNGNIVKNEVAAKKIKDAEACVTLAYCHFFDKARVFTYKTSVRKWRFDGTSLIKDPGIFGFEETIWKTKGDNRKTLYDEELIGEGKITYERVGEIYRLLRQNFESRLAFDQASDFHIGQMEMLLADPVFPDSKKFFLRLYRLLSNFGEDPWRPLLWLIVVWYFGFLSLTTVTVTNTVPGLEEIINGDFVMPWGYVLNNVPTTLQDLITAIIGPFKIAWGNIGVAFKNFIVFPQRQAPAIYFVINTLQKLAGGTLITFAILALRRAFRR